MLFLFYYKYNLKNLFLAKKFLSIKLLINFNYKTYKILKISKINKDKIKIAKQISKINPNIIFTGRIASSLLLENNLEINDIDISSIDNFLYKFQLDDTFKNNKIIIMTNILLMVYSSMYQLMLLCLSLFLENIFKE